LSQLPLNRAAAAPLAPRSGALNRTRNERLGEWIASGRGVTLPVRLTEREREGLNGELGAYDDDSEFGQVLGAIADEVHRHCAAVCAGITAEFAARCAHARRTLPRNQLAGALQAFSEARKAAFAHARREASLALQARKQAATILHRLRCARPSASGSIPSGGSPGPGPS